MEQEKPSILIVEDESLLLEAITKKMKVSNIEPLGFSSGVKALEYLETAPVLPHAIWLDYYLKDMSGLIFLTEMKKRKKLENIPVIVISNSASPDSVRNMLAQGAKKYLLKSDYTLEELIEIVRGFIDENKKNTKL